MTKTRSLRSLLVLTVGGVAIFSSGCNSDNDDDTVVPPGSGGASASGGSAGGAGGVPVSGGAGGTSPTPDAGPPPVEDASPSVDADPLSGVLTPGERAEVAKLSPLPAVPADTTNQYADNAGAAALGKKLFFDTRYSGPLAVGDDGGNGAVGAVGDSGKLACASCHAGPGLDDRRSKPGNLSLGADYLGRNALPLVNSSFYKWTNWGGRFAAQWELPIAVAEAGKNMNSNRLRIAHLVFDHYKSEYEAVFGALEPAIGTDAARFPAAGKPKAAGTADGAWEGMSTADQQIVNRIFVNYAKALAAYTRKLVSRDAPFDRFVAGDASALSASQLRGLRLFLDKAKCVGCHSGPHFSDSHFHNIGVGQSGPRAPATDDGRFGDLPGLLGSALNVDGVYSDDRTSGRLTGLTTPPPESMRGQFRTPSLRQIAETAPYMHAGQLATLEDVVAYYNKGGDAPAVGSKDPLLTPLNLTAEERGDLVAFLKSLTGAPLPASLTNP